MSQAFIFYCIIENGCLSCLIISMIQQIFRENLIEDWRKDEKN